MASRPTTRARASTQARCVRRWANCARSRCSRFEAARARAGALDDATRTALLPVATVPLYLELMSRRDYNPFRWVAEPQPWRRQWRLWRAARAGL